jgi:hypothetical protein
MPITPEELTVLNTSPSRLIKTAIGRENITRALPADDLYGPYPYTYRRPWHWFTALLGVLARIGHRVLVPALIAVTIASGTWFVCSAAVAVEHTQCRHLDAIRPAGTTRWVDMWIGCAVLIDGAWVPVDNWKETSR